MGDPAPPAPQPQNEVGLKERFFRYFQHEVTALQDQMERLRHTSFTGGERNDAVDHCLAGIDRLSHEVKDASSYIPAYDQRTYSEAIKALSEKLQNIRSSFNPPKKFTFKTARKNPSAISLADAAELAQRNKLRVPGYGSDLSNTNSSFAPTPLDRLTPTEEKKQQEVANPGTGASDTADGEAAVTTNPNNSVTLSNHTRSHIVLSTEVTGSGTVSNLHRSVVDLSQPTTKVGPFSGLVLKNIQDSLVVCGQVSGPAHITAIENSLIVVSCRQFRMHASKNVDVYLYCSSRPIIEDCENIRFAPLPETYTTADLSSSPNQWDQIDDFKWLKSEPSPHYNLLPEEQRVQEEIWKDKVLGGNSLSLDDILNAVNVPKATA